MLTKPKTSPHYVRKRLIASSEAYVESVGKTDIDTLGYAVDSPDGKGNIVRLILGATTHMPLRALTYVDSAVRIAQLLPCEQLQIIHANKLGSRVNGINPDEARRQAELLALATRNHVQKIAPDIAERLLHAEDTPLDLSPFLPLSEAALAYGPIGEKLLQKGAKHGGDAVVYAAAHCAFQDTDQLELSALMADSPDQVQAERIISVGCEQERTFYAARMAMRQLAVSIDLVPTAQIFTKHISPPYFMARGGEQGLEHALIHGMDMSLAGDISTVRDLTHLQTLMTEKDNG